MQLLKRRLVYSKSITAIAAINLILISIVFLIKDSLPPIIPIYYGLPSGSDQLGPSSSLALLPLTSFIVLFIHSIFINFSEDKFLRKTMLAISVLATFLSSYAYFRILLLVASF